MSFIQATANVDSSATVGAGTKVWHLAQVREGARIGDHCVLGSGCYVGVGVIIGDACKIQNQAQIFEPAELMSGVFVGPGAVLTNDQYPRAITPEGRPKAAGDWKRTGVRCETGASIGALSVCVAPVTIGRWALVAAGAVVTRDVLPFSSVSGVPARFNAWVGRSGSRLTLVGPGTWRCPVTGDRFREQGGAIEEVGHE